MWSKWNVEGWEPRRVPRDGGMVNGSVGKSLTSLPSHAPSSPLAESTSNSLLEDDGLAGFTRNTDRA